MFTIAARLAVKRVVTTAKKLLDSTNYTLLAWRWRQLNQPTKIARRAAAEVKYDVNATQDAYVICTRRCDTIITTTIYTPKKKKCTKPFNFRKHKLLSL